MLHTDIQKQLQDLSLEDTLALLQLAAEQVNKKARLEPLGAKASDSRDEREVERKKALKSLSRRIKRLNLALPPDYKFDREEANARR